MKFVNFVGSPIFWIVVIVVIWLINQIIDRDDDENLY